MNVIFHQPSDIPVASMPDELHFSLSTRKPVDALDGCPGCDAPADGVDDATDAGVADVGHNVPQPIFGDTLSVNVPQCKYPLNVRLAVGDLFRITSIRGRARVQALAGLTVNDALTMSYFVGGRYRWYKCKDLNYDAKNVVVVVVLDANPVVQATNCLHRQADL